MSDLIPHRTMRTNNVRFDPRTNNALHFGGNFENYLEHNPLINNLISTNNVRFDPGKHKNDPKKEKVDDLRKD